MKKIVFGALCTLALAACGGGGSKKADAGDINVTADAAPDAGAVCNAFTQAGCEAGEKCANLDVTAELSQTTCVPDGTVTEGQACTVGEPGETTGFDDCVAGYSCLGGVCTAICQTTPDSCRDEATAWDEGNYCTLYNGLFNGDVGLCVAACNPVDDTVAAGAVLNADCAEGTGCYLNAGRGIAACAGIPQPAATLGQNADCYGPAPGQCFLNGCASGFAPYLNDVVDDDGAWCTRMCNPENTYLEGGAGSNLVGNPKGTGDKCGAAALTALGGVNGRSSLSNHECRFVQGLYSDTDMVPDSVGACVPNDIEGWGGTCEDFQWVNMYTAWNDAIVAMTDPQEAVDALCVDPGDDGMPGTMDDVLKDECWGYYRGCISNTKIDEDLDDPPMTAQGTAGRMLRDHMKHLMPKLPKEQLEQLQGLYGVAPTDPAL